MSLFTDEDLYESMSMASFEAVLKRMSTKQREELYLKAKDTYYSGKPIMPDPLFDRLESWLDSEGSKVVAKVGGTDQRKSKLIHKHMTPMLSLSKIQVNDEDAFLNGTPSTFADEGGRMPIEEIDAWFSGWETSAYPVEAGPKLDGSAIELQYRGEGHEKVLTLAVTRGDDGLGANITANIKLIGVPEKIISAHGDVEVRGEVVIPVSVFKEKYAADYKNPRNMVAGVLQRDEEPEEVKDFVFVAYSIKFINEKGVHYPEVAMETLERVGFNRVHKIPIYTITDKAAIIEVYKKMKEYRSVAPFQLDGIVLKSPENQRAAMGETRHHPRWAVAIKFPSNEATTRILSVDYTVGYTGEIAPTAVLEPVELDGSTVERASLYNFKSMATKGTLPGAVVSIRKAGEIIPQIVAVLEPMPPVEWSDIAPKECPSCGHATRSVVDPKSDAVHVYCSNDNCTAKATRRLHMGVSALKISGIGESTCESLVKAGIKTIHQLFTPGEMNPAWLITSGHFKKGRQLDLLMAAVKGPRRVELRQVIRALAYEGVGNTISEELAKNLSGVSHSFDSLEMAKIEPFLDQMSEQSKALSSLRTLLESSGATVTAPIEKSAGSIVYEMTGSPCAPFKTKDDFIAAVAAKGYSHGKIAAASMLITDSYSSSSGKMKTAAKKGLVIKTYEDLVEELGL